MLAFLSLLNILPTGHPVLAPIDALAPSFLAAHSGTHHGLLKFGLLH
jgi:hypothetical protein